MMIVILVFPDNSSIQFRGFRTLKFDDAVGHNRRPESGDKIVVLVFIRIRESMEHVSHIPLAITVIKPFARSELTWFHIPLALARPQEYVSATAFLNGSQGDIMMFVFVAVSDKIFTLIIPSK